MADIKNSFSKGLTVLNVKTSTFLELNKIKTYISNLNEEIAVIKKEIGEMVYQEWAKTGQVTTEYIEIKLQGIQNRMEIIRQQEEEAERINQKEKQILGAQDTPQTQMQPQQQQLQSPNQYQEAAQPQADQELVFKCPGCGQDYDTAPKFCRKCGTRMN